MLCDEEGNITRYYYDAAANITKEILPNGYDKRADDALAISMNMMYGRTLTE